MIIMSEGDRWLLKAVGDLSLALRSGWEGKPVECAHLLVRLLFATFRRTFY